MIDRPRPRAQEETRNDQETRAEDQCGAVSAHLVCDRESGHSGSHRGYDEQIDEPMFWGN